MMVVSLFSFEVIVSDQCDKKTGGDDQEKDWKRCRVSRDKAVQMVHNKVSPVVDFRHKYIS